VPSGLKKTRAGTRKTSWARDRLRRIRRRIALDRQEVAELSRDQWRCIGLNVTHTPQEGGSYFNDFRHGKFDAGIDFTCEFMDEPDLYLL